MTCLSMWSMPTVRPRSASGAHRVPRRRRLVLRPRRGCPDPDRAGRLALVRDLGWPLVLGVCGLAFAASLVCWLVGYQLGPGTSHRGWPRPGPGDLVPIELTLRANASLLVWPFLAVVQCFSGPRSAATTRSRGHCCTAERCRSAQESVSAARRATSCRRDDQGSSGELDRVADPVKRVIHRSHTRVHQLLELVSGRASSSPARACRPRRRPSGTLGRGVEDGTQRVRWPIGEIPPTYPVARAAGAAGSAIAAAAWPRPLRAIAFRSSLPGHRERL